MKKNNLFNNLIIFEMANNHMGKVSHGKKIIRELFNYLSKNPRKYINKELLKKDKKERVVGDFIAGMTDRYAINLHKEIK